MIPQDTFKEKAGTYYEISRQLESLRKQESDLKVQIEDKKDCMKRIEKEMQDNLGSNFPERVALIKDKSKETIAVLRAKLMNDGKTLGIKIHEEF